MASIEKVFLLKVCYSIFASILVLFLYLKPAILKQISSQKYALGITFVLTRLLPFVGVYLLMNETPRGDVPFFYWKASSIYDGKIVYKDFWSYHAPLFSYLLALPLIFWHSAKAIVFLLCIGEGICLITTMNYFKKLNKQNPTKEAIIYLLLPAPFIIMLLGGQEDIWLWGIAISAMMVYWRTKNAFLMSLVLSLGLVVLKITFVLIFVPIFFAVNFRSKAAMILGSLALVVPVFAITYYFVGTDFLMFIKHTETPFSPNFHSILHPIFASFFNYLSLTKINWIGLGIIFSALIATGFYIKDMVLHVIFPYVWIICFGLMNVILPASMIYYVFIYLVAIWFFVIEKGNLKDIFSFLFFNILIVIQPYLFVVLGQKMYPNFAFMSEPLRAFEYLIQVILVLYICYYIVRAFKNIQALR